MHFEYTLHFWTLITQVVALSGFLTFLWKVYKAISDVIDGIKVILAEHREVYNWYHSLREKRLTLPKEAEEI